MTINTTLVINAKGGVGKSTISTNLASYFASRDITTTIADFWFLPFQTENQTSSPAALYSGCTTRLGPSPSFAQSAIGSTL